MKKLFLIYLFFATFIMLTLQCSTKATRARFSDEKEKIAYEAEKSALARGKDIWIDPNTGTNGFSCESCHPDGLMTNAETYPRYKHVLRRMATLSMTHNFAVVNESKGKPWKIGSDDANALVLYVKSLSNGKKIRMAQPAKYRNECIEAGKSLFFDLASAANKQSCNSCHNKNNESIPELKGIAAKYPRYSFRQQRVVILEQEIAYCLNNYLKMKISRLDDEQIVALCCYLTSLSKGKKISVAKE